MKQLVFYKDENSKEPAKRWLQTLDITLLKE